MSKKLNLKARSKQEAKNGPSADRAKETLGDHG
jgi:hypothetical protein